MARSINRRAGGRFLVPGAYRDLLRRQCELEVGPDPRVCLGGERSHDYALAKERAALRAEELFARRVTAAEPVAVPAWWVSGRRNIPAAPEWLSRPAIYGGARAVRVFADDTVMALDEAGK